MAHQRLMAVWQFAPENGHDNAQQIAKPVPMAGWSAAVSVGNQIWHQKASSLEVLLSQAKLCRSASKTSPVWLGFKDRAFEIALFLPDPLFKVFQVVCLPQWSAQDIEAECWLEAAQQMQQNTADLLLDFKVNLAPAGLLLATAMVCETRAVQIYAQQFLQWGLKLAIISSHSQARAL